MSKKEGFYNTPNKMIPLNDREPGTLAPVALRALEFIRSAAQTWPIHRVRRDNRNCNVCRMCQQNIWFDKDEEGQEFLYTEAEKLALIVAHIRQRHTSDNGEIDDCSEEPKILDFSRGNDTPGSYYGHLG